MTAPRVLVVGIGNEFRRDDGAGLCAARAAAPHLPSDVVVVELDGEPTRLVDAWSDAPTVFVVDAVRTGRAPGTVHRLDFATDSLPPWRSHGGTHALGIAAAIDLGRAVARLPGRLVIFGIEGADFGPGPGLTPAVERATGEVARRLVHEAAAPAARAGGS